jgi:hypothetical protein
MGKLQQQVKEKIRRRCSVVEEKTDNEFVITGFKEFPCGRTAIKVYLANDRESLVEARQWAKRWEDDPPFQGLYVEIVEEIDPELAAEIALAGLVAFAYDKAHWSEPYAGLLIEEDGYTFFAHKPIDYAE